MTTISAAAAPRIHRTAASAATTGRISARTSRVLVGLLLALIALLVVDNHVMALPGASFAEIGVARARLDRAEAALGSGLSGTSAHDLHRCFVDARRSGQDPAGCRVSKR